MQKRVQEEKDALKRSAELPVCSSIRTDETGQKDVPRQIGDAIHNLQSTFLKDEFHGTRNSCRPPLFMATPPDPSIFIGKSHKHNLCYKTDHQQLRTTLYGGGRLFLNQHRIDQNKQQE